MNQLIDNIDDMTSIQLQILIDDKKNTKVI